MTFDFLIFLLIFNNIKTYQYFFVLYNIKADHIMLHLTLCIMPEHGCQSC